MHPAPITPHIHVNDWVQHADGRTGLIIGWSARKALVQFSPSGPIHKVGWRDLTRATPAQIAQMTGET